MSEANDGEPAFPVPVGEREFWDREENGSPNGMSIRDYFAAAEQIADDDAGNWELLEALAGKRPDGNWTTNPLGWLAWDCKWRAAIKYGRADAMLVARKEGA
jgi:hypothetical protein